ncbi:NADPH-dependent F420 reductase [Jiangella endophytica]|uniref:NADPH-dependent F420 reductase n=1 Tax=Jiangella endophytica TaxID=1623398 RepID=UPI000E354347|nr:diguanylate cyclase [Jiangella endophytica]
MAHISIIGTGNMGQAIAGLAGRGGNTFELLDTTTLGTPLAGDIVVLAVPHTSVDDVLTRRGAELDGRIVVDITNPVDVETFDGLVVPPDSSAAARIAARLPGARVLKAFNTTFAGAVAGGSVGPVTTTVLIAGDDGDAKSALAAVVSAGGLRAVDVGSLKRARELEALGFLQISLAATEKITWTGGFALVS